MSIKLTEVIHKRKGTIWGKNTFSEEAFCGFLFTVARDDPTPTFPMTHSSCVSTCPDCEEAYALSLLAELP